MQDLTPFLGLFVPHHFNAGYISLSFLISLAGCWTAVELLHKRTGSHGTHNWYAHVVSGPRIVSLHWFLTQVSALRCGYSHGSGRNLVQ